MFSQQFLKFTLRYNIQTEQNMGIGKKNTTQAGLLPHCRSHCMGARARVDLRMNTCVCTVNFHFNTGVEGSAGSSLSGLGCVL